MKKIFGISLISLFAFALSFSLISNNNKTYQQAKADSIEEVETTAFLYIAGSSGSTDAHLVVHLTDNDYGASSQFSYNSSKAKIDALNFASHIYLNDKLLNFDSYNADGFKLGSEIHTNTFSPTTGTFSIRINFNGSTTSDITSIKLAKGCQIPSVGYLSDTSDVVYTMPSNVRATPANCNYDWLTYMDTDVYNVVTTGNTYLGITISVNDYIVPSGTVDGTIGDIYTNYATNVTVDNEVNVVQGYGLLSYQNAYDTIWIQTSANSSTINTVNIPAGTLFSSYNHVKANPKWPLLFKTTTVRTFTRNGAGVFTPVFKEVETEVIRSDLTSINNQWLSFGLSVCDYTTAHQNSFSKSAGYNFWQEIVITDNNDIEHTLYDICATNAHIFNFSNVNENEFSVNLVNPYYNFGYVKKIVIPAGTKFPEYAYLAGTNHNQPKAYVTTVDKEFIYGTNHKYAEVKNTTITGMGFNENGYLGFVLSNNDYPALGNTDGGMETYYANFRSQIDVSNIGLTFDSAYSLWSYTPLDDSIAPHVSGTLHSGVVHISAGVLFPSYVFSHDNNTDPVVYKVSEDASFGYNGTAFIDISQPWSISNTITGLETHGSKGTNDFAIDIMLNEFDWPNDVTNLDLINNGTYGDNAYKSHYNTFDKIKAYDSSDNLLYFTSEIFVNVWGKTGCLSIRLNSPSVYMERLSYIVISSGLELPTYGGFYVDAGSSKFSDNSYYLVSESYVFMYSDDNGSFLQSNYLEKGTTITAVNEVEPYAQNSIITFSLGTQDYDANLNVTGSYRTAFNNLNFGSYITINGVKLSDLAEYNSTYIYISNSGTISIRTPGNNTGYYYINSGDRVYTDNLTKYEIRIAKGCQFPSYDSLMGETNVPTCYSVNKDYSFAWFDGHYVLEDNNFVNLDVEDLNVSSVGYKNAGASDRMVYISLPDTDWPLGATFSGDIKNTVACPDFLSHVEVYDVDGDVHLPTTSEVFINVWGTGAATPSIGFRTDITTHADIKSVVIYEGCLIPSYDKYLGNSDSWYMVREKTTFYSSLDGAFYIGSNLSAVEFASEFNGAFAEVCTGYDGTSSNLTALSNKFYAFKNIYDNELSSAVKTEISNSEDETILAMYSVYDYVVQKYGLTNFLGSDFSKSSNNSNNNVLVMITNNANNNVIIAIIVTAFAVTTLVVYFVKRKADHKS